ncbi:copper-binding transcription factor [Marasmius tenuissimus]|nr:copper-binding transcription factor [Marasmius tenuissimus]
MVLISSKKYACETCIKGHRSSSCKHTDRPLFEIKKKGRPVTQCEHCRELRKTKQVHVKCICIKADGTPASSKGSNKALESAAFPNGLPEALEASVALQLLSEGHSSDSDHAGGCQCHKEGGCNCCTPRKSAPRRRKKEPSEDKSHPGSGANTPPNVAGAFTSDAALTRVAELRPVLPKPALTRRPEHPDGPIHEASAGHHHTHGGRLHDASLYSPYGRAYDYNHPHHHTSYTEDSSAISPDEPPSLNFGYSASMPFASTSSSSPIDERAPGVVGRGAGSPSNTSTFEQGDLSPWYSAPTTGGVGDVIASFCGCGEECGCQGCTIHVPTSNTNRPNPTCGSPSGSACCASCLNCSALAGAPPLAYAGAIPPNTALSIHQSQDNGRDLVDEWVRQLDGSYSSAAPTFDLAAAGYGDFGMEMYNLPNGMSGCRCPPGLCQCGAESGCGCGGCERQSQGFAVSGERGCCDRGAQTPPVFDDSPSGLPGFYNHLNASLETMPPNAIAGQMQFRSRSSSSSSSSASSNHSHFIGMLLGTPSPHETAQQQYF